MKDRRILWLLGLIFLASCLSLPWLDRPLVARGESREALVAQSIVEDGNFVLPRGYGGIVASKPPFTHWLMAGSALATGKLSEFETRLPAAVAWVGFIAFFYIFLTHRTSNETAILASVILLTSVEWFRAADSTRVDTVLAVLMASAVMLLARWFEGRLVGPLVLFGCCVTAGVLTKGPVALALPVVVLGLAAVAMSEPLLPIVKRISLIVVPAVLLSGLWYVAAWIDGGSEFVDRVRYENVSRLTGSMADEPHKHGVLYLYATVLLGLLPTTLLLFVEVVLRVRDPEEDGKHAERRPLRVRLTHWWNAQQIFEKFFLLAIVVWVAFFSIPASKRGVYLLPIYPALAYFAAKNLTKMRTYVAPVVLFVQWTIMALLLSVVAISIASFVLPSGTQDVPGFVTDFSRFATHLRKSWNDLAAIFVLLAGTAWVLFTRRRPPSLVQLHHAGVGWVVVLTILSGWYLSAVSSSASPKGWHVEVAKELDAAPNVPVFSFATEFYALDFYLHGRLKRAEVFGKLPDDVWVVVLEKHRAELREGLLNGYVEEDRPPALRPPFEKGGDTIRLIRARRLAPAPVGKPIPG